MFGISGVEFVLILLFVFIIFGADRLPEIARVLGKAIAKFRKAQAEMNTAIQADVKNLETDEQPFQKSVEAFDKFGKETVATVKNTVSEVQKKNTTSDAAAKAGAAPASLAGAAAVNAAGAAAEGVEEKEPEPASAPAPAPTDAAPQAPAVGAKVTPAAPRRESFTERKARYEAERAAKEAAAAAPAEAAAPAAAAAEPAPDQEKEV